MRITARTNSRRKIKGVMGDSRISGKRNGEVFCSCTPRQTNKHLGKRKDKGHRRD